MAKINPKVECEGKGPHNPDGKLYEAVYRDRQVRDVAYACDKCLEAMKLKKGPELDLSELATCNVNASNPTGVWK